MNAIQIENLTKTYRNGSTALDNLNLDVKESTVFTLLGPNGAGKSSLINILTTSLLPTSGAVTILGKDLFQEGNKIRTQIACVGQSVSVDDHLSLEQNFKLQSRLYHLEATEAKSRTAQLIELFGLTEHMKKKVIQCSGGIQRRLDIAVSMISHPKILFLDEPTVGLDIESRRIVWEIIRQIKEDFGTTIFLTTHYLEEAEQLSDYITIMKHGRNIAQGTPAALRKYTQENIVRIQLSSPNEAQRLYNNVNNLDYVKTTRFSNETVHLTITEGKATFASLGNYLSEHEYSFEAIEWGRPSLDDIFLEITKTKGGTSNDPARIEALCS